MSLKSIIAITFVTIAYTSLQCVSVVMKDFPNVTTSDCGIGLDSRLLGGCFEWHKGYHDLGDIHMGRNVSWGEMPWVVKLVRYLGSGYLDCTGVILNTRFVLTAAHCLVCNGTVCNPWHIAIRVYQWQFANQTFIHPMYIATNDTNYDIGIIELSRDLEFIHSLEYGVYAINSICLPIENYTQRERELALVSGWGNTHRTEARDAGRLQMGWVNVMATAINESDAFGKLIRTWPSGKGSVATCEGDSGAPIIQYNDGRAVLIGIRSTSIGNQKYYCHGYSIYTKDASVRISYFVNWIVNTVRNVV